MRTSAPGRRPTCALVFLRTWNTYPLVDHWSPATSVDRYRGDRVSVESHTGARWALLRPPVAGRVHVERLTLQVQEDLATMPIAQFRQKYREFTE